MLADRGTSAATESWSRHQRFAHCVRRLPVRGNRRTEGATAKHPAPLKVANRNGADPKDESGSLTRFVVEGRYESASASFFLKSLPKIRARPFSNCSKR